MLLSTAARSVSSASGLGRRAASGIASKYAKAVFGAALAKSPQTLNKVHSDLVNISNTVKKDAEVADFVTNPTLSLQERKKALETLYTKLEGTGAKKEQVSDITKNLLIVLAENGRLAETESVIESFNEFVAQYKGELTVTVTSAVPLAKDVLSRLESTLKQSQTAQAAKTLKVENKVNASILGGLIVDFGDKTIDLSVVSRVTKLNNVLTQSV
ncbi:OSCP/delta subunit of ATPase [Gymnopilus junonius]|uniref:ATP synthase subunit 5, mitochondrial n=1 Tax=Gymnopilus junonius TaxID=109634 RepID=A0A9P5TPK5_GYMJU|nr:OSCP/delta subunit of ATPase [Gymnopilus junonius]